MLTLNIYIYIYIEYTDDVFIEEFVKETATATNREPEKANVWIKKLKSQDIMILKFINLNIFCEYLFTKQQLFLSCRLN